MKGILKMNKELELLKELGVDITQVDENELTDRKGEDNGSKE